MRHRSKENEFSGLNSLYTVMPGRDPGIHALMAVDQEKDVDGRDWPRP